MVEVWFCKASCRVLIIGYTITIKHVNKITIYYQLVPFLLSANHSEVLANALFSAKYTLALYSQVRC
jgi:hypothetical protein